jgi:acetyl/propionyl-CoA carboxylase alpha subunit
LAKVITWAETRAGAIRKMQNALRDYVLLGVTTNREFLLGVLAHPEFQAGRATTTFIEEHLQGWQPDPGPVPKEALLAAALADLQAPVPAAPVAGEVHDPYSPWRQTDSFRLGAGGRE